MRARSRCGHTLLELMIALTLFLVLGYGVGLALSAARTSNDAVDLLTEADRGLRAASTALLDDLRASNATHVVVTAQADGNDSATVQARIQSGGALAWGVHERALGPTPAEQDRPGWFVRYRVVPGAEGRELLREVLDAGGVTQRSSVIARALSEGTGTNAAFRLARVGDVWEATVTTRSSHSGQPGTRTVIHATHRNE